MKRGGKQSPAPKGKAAAKPRAKQQQQNPDSSSSSGVDELLGHRILAGLAPMQEDYVVPAQKSAASGGVVGAGTPNEFAGVRVTRGTLAIFGDDTAKQFALHIDKMLKEGRGGSAAGKGKDQITSLLVKNGDVSNRSAMLRNDAVPLFEQQMGTLLNASLRQRELRQREDDDTKAGKKEDDDGDSDGGDSDAFGGGDSD